jgi:hypothetical protein
MEKRTNKKQLKFDDAKFCNISSKPFNIINKYKLRDLHILPENLKGHHV